MKEEKQFHEVCKEMRSIVTMEEVDEFIRLLRNEEGRHDQLALNLELAANSEYLTASNKKALEDAAAQERRMAAKWNAIWAVFDHASYYRVKN